MGKEIEEKDLRYRRAQSVTKAEEISEKEKKARKSQVDKPCHVPRDSLFSWSSDFANFTGLVNWGFLMLSIGGLRLCLENFLKYGIRVNPIEWIIILTGYNEGRSHQYPSIILILFTIVPVVICLLIEKGIAVKMMRTYKPRTERRNLDEEGIKTAVSKVTLKVLSIKKAAENYDIKPATLQYRVEKFRKASEEN
ncbi:Diacylglycerol O-acyltransferase 1 [Eumeta japonica]|uniref:diacylglycerol O-acyltransferase n=1 Tax=Eumeta variegata TaxID=151549 RepID=A0A4C1UNH1_EUMVA|nr:Diacylglycerol O-acyltransferase 1 [Eumeta japonica]